MGPLVMKERFKETRVHSCGNTEAWYDKGQGREAQITAKNTHSAEKKQKTIYIRTLVWYI
jgi:hypothetical protein